MMANKFVMPSWELGPGSYRYQEFPMILYRDGAYKVVKSEEEEAAALDEGWGKNPDHKTAKVEPIPEPETELAEPEVRRKPGRPRTAKA